RRRRPPAPLGRRRQDSGSRSAAAGALPPPSRQAAQVSTMNSSFDDAVVGAGIIGLAHAYHLARAGRRVGVFERSPRPQGASVRNFGMLWPIGQPPGTMLQLALRSRAVWLEVLREAGLLAGGV